MTFIKLISCFDHVFQYNVTERYFPKMENSMKKMGLG